MHNIKTIILQNKVLEEAIYAIEKIMEQLDLSTAVFNSLKPEQQKRMIPEYAQVLQRIYNKTNRIKNLVIATL